MYIIFDILWSKEFSFNSFSIIKNNFKRALKFWSLYLIFSFQASYNYLFKSLSLSLNFPLALKPYWLCIEQMTVIVFSQRMNYSFLLMIVSKVKADHSFPFLFHSVHLIRESKGYWNDSFSYSNHLAPPCEYHSNLISQEDLFFYLLFILCFITIEHF